MPTINYIYHGNQYLCETDENDTPTKLYVNEPGTYTNLVSQKDLTTGEKSYPLYDAVGSTRAVTGSNGDVTDTFVYDAWGNVLDRTGTTGIKFQYVGQYGYYRDEETETNYVMARNYDPGIIRWLSIDPVFMHESQYHEYAYVSNTPNITIDPTGLAPFGKIPIPATTPGTCNAAIISTYEDSAFLCYCFGPMNGYTKCKAIKEKESPVTLIKKVPIPDVSISTNPKSFFCGRPKVNQYFGPEGMETSIGFIVQMPNKGSFSVVHGHMSGLTIPSPLLEYAFPIGSHGVICGGNNENVSNCLLAAIRFLFTLNAIKFDGIVNWDACFVGHDGHYYVRSTNSPSKNNPSCFGG